MVTIPVVEHRGTHSSSRNLERRILQLEKLVATLIASNASGVSTTFYVVSPSDKTYVIKTTNGKITSLAISD